MAYTSSFLLRQEACPKCREKGNDVSGDNLAVYSDNHAFCFRCGYFRPGNGDGVFHSNEHVTPPKHKGDKTSLPCYLPDDCCTDYTTQELEWIGQYGLDRNTLLKNNVLHSDKGIRFNRRGVLNYAKNILIFPVFDDGLLGYQARTFSSDVPKWIGKGNFKNIFNILPGRSTLILTEDIISAIKVNMVDHASMPVYGSTIKNRFERLYKLGYRDVIIWLDGDMHSKVVKEVIYAHGINTRIIFSDKDPKEYSLKEIKEWLK